MSRGSDIDPGDSSICVVRASSFVSHKFLRKHSRLFVFVDDLPASLADLFTVVMAESMTGRYQDSKVLTELLSCVLSFISASNQCLEYLL